MFVHFLTSLYLIVALSSSAGNIPRHEITITDNELHELSNERYISSDYVIHLPNANKLMIEIVYVDVTTANGDYLLIKRGPNFEDPGTGMVYTGRNIEEVKKLIIPSRTILIRFFALKEPRTFAPRGFKLRYKAIGQKLTTTEKPSSPTTFPTPAGSDKTHYKVHISGRYDYEYKESRSLRILKTAFKEMAILYCKDNAIPLAEPVTENNVKISELERCPYSWPNSEDCVTVDFYLPVILAEEHHGYELLAKHLEVMWERHHTELHKHGLRRYEMQDLQAAMVHWEVYLGIVIALLIVGVAAICVMRELCPGCHRHKGDDEVMIVTEEVRASYVPNEHEFDKFNEARKSVANPGRHSEL